ncbi:MAG: hypothetical protein M0020_06670 [Actinomycetota bacterium]|nr:hypothetical protein [Actinomycetota bacterium]
MAFKVETKDCTALSDSELSELADLCGDRLTGFDIGYLSKQRDEWVLISQVRENNKLRGYSFSTLERIGGTPAILLGLASVARHSRADSVLKAIMAEQYRRALLAFPDEDVLVGTRFVDPAALVAFTGLADVVPAPGQRATGEERAWGRRLAKRFGADGRLDDRTFVLTGDGSTLGHVDFDSAKAQAKIAAERAPLFDCLDTGRGDCLVAFGWAMAESLAAGRIA